MDDRRAPATELNAGTIIAQYFLRSQRIDRDPQRPRRCNKPAVIACQLHIFASRTQECDRGKMQGVKRTDGDWERLKGTGEDGWSEIDELNPVEERARLDAMRTRQPTRVNSIPNFVFEQLT
jgi:hypothetical protein